jgi:hypothetical protein
MFQLGLLSRREVRDFGKAGELVLVHGISGMSVVAAADWVLV